jgi:hypothetical protein
MIAHQYVTIDTELVSLFVIGKYLKIFQKVFLVSEYTFSPVAPRYHMIERTFVLYPWFPRHIPTSFKDE